MRSRYPTCKNCAHCGVLFLTNRDAQKYCSQKCSCRATSADRSEKRRKLAAKQCPTCKSEFKPRTKKQKYCSKKCVRGRGVTRYTYTCQQCSASFESVYLNRKYCSPKCTGADKKTLLEKPCPACGKVFRPSGRNTQKYCSWECYDRTINPHLPPAGTDAREQAYKQSEKSRARTRNRDMRAALRDAGVADAQRHMERYSREVTRGAYSGSLEEYTEHIESRRLRGSVSWLAWASWAGEEIVYDDDGKPARSYVPKPKLYDHPRMSDAHRYRWRYRHDKQFMLRERMRRQFKKWMLKDRKTAPSFLKSIDYSLPELYAHLESQFEPGMSWDNHGEWHIDHIIPRNLFDATKPGHVRQCWALSNLRPLWASKNCARPRDGSDVLHLQIQESQ